MSRVLDIERLHRESIPPDIIERITTRVMAALNNAVKAPKDSNAQKQAVANAISGISDLLDIPAAQQCFAAGMAAELRQAYDAARIDGRRPALIGGDLRKLRIAAGVSQTALARHIGQLQANVAHWERGTFPVPAKHIPAILDYLGTFGLHCLG